VAQGLTNWANALLLTSLKFIYRSVVSQARANTVREEQREREREHNLEAHERERERGEEHMSVSEARNGTVIDDH
jgi:nitroimidazol reductase NimA-like FMN-containing flavoprotein (pyridoxamine 5'-phosphate oxidase superfamily)